MKSKLSIKELKKYMEGFEAGYSAAMMVVKLKKKVVKIKK